MLQTSVLFMHTIKLPYGKKDDELYHVDVVVRGANCECVCPKCEGALIAAKGEYNIAHFRHVDVSQCEGAAEYALREQLMKLFLDAGELMLPESHLKIEGENRILVEKETVEIESVEAISGGDPFTPRFIIRTRSSYEGEREIRAVVNLGSKDAEVEEGPEPYVEIRLDELGDDYSVDRLIRSVIRDTRCIHWGRRPRAKEREAELREELRVIRTTPEDRDRLLFEARKSTGVEAPRPPASLGSTSYFEAKGDKKYEPREPGHSNFASQFAGISFTCEECGQTGLSHNEMQRVQPDYGTGVCYDCKGVRRANAHENDDYSAAFKATAATFYQRKGQI